MRSAGAGRAHPFMTDRIQYLDGSRRFQRALWAKAGQGGRCQQGLFLQLFYTAGALQRSVKKCIASRASAAMIGFNRLGVRLGLAGGIIVAIDGYGTVLAKARIRSLRHRRNDEQGKNDQQ